MDSLTLAAVAAELTRVAVGRRLGPAVIPRREQLAVALDEGALFCSIAPHDPRVQRLPDRPPGLRPEPSLQTHFDSLLRGAEVLAVRCVEFDRVLHLDLDGVDRVGDRRRLRLIVELMGKHSACCLVDEAGMILATLKPVTAAVNRHRQLLPRVPYVPPPTGDRRDPLTLDRADFLTILAAGPDPRAAWRRQLFGLSDELWGYLCRGLPDGDLDGLWAAWSEVAERVRTGRFEPCLVRDEAGWPQAAWPLPLPGGEPVATISEALAAVAEVAAERLATRQARGELAGRLRRAEARVASGLKGLHRRRERAAEAADWQLRGELLLTNLHRLQPRQERLEVEDWTRPGETLLIELEPGLTGPQNAERYFERARQARQGAVGLAEEEAALMTEQARLTRLRERLAQAGPADLAEIEAELPGDDRATGRQRPPKTERERLLRSLTRRTSSDGFTILIGRNARESEGLLSRLAAPTDLWFHVRGAGSGHVIVRAEGRPDEVPARTITEAAILAARTSKARHSDVVPVVYTQRKYVTKITGGQAGKVVYRGERTLFVDPTADS